MKNIVVITDPGSVDPDDIFALLLLAHFKKCMDIDIKGIIATHHFPHKRAQLVKLLFAELGLPDVKVYQGQGVSSSPNFNEKEREQFDNDNKLWPSFFGYPKSVKREGEREWFPNFRKAYEEFYGTEHLESFTVEAINGTDFLIQQLKEHSPDHRLLVICLAPMHDLVNIPKELYMNMDLWAMGGGFEDEHFYVPKAGYNWGICPSQTNTVLQKLTDSKTSMHLISSNIVRKKNVVISTDVYQRWIASQKNKLGSAIMKDWEYCNRGNALKEHKNLCDPLTLYLAITDQGVYRYFETTVKNEDKLTNYMEVKPGFPLITMASKIGNTLLLTNFNESIRDDIVERIENVLF